MSLHTLHIIVCTNNYHKTIRTNTSIWFISKVYFYVVNFI